jgi:ribosomal protein S18 acetylase RimI-like enzyme
MKAQLVLTSVAQMLQVQHWFHSAEQQQSWGGDNFDYPCTELRFLKLLCRPGTQSFGLVSEDNQQLLGFGQICDRFGCHHLARLAVHPQRRGQGLGKTLVFELIIHALAQQRRDISLYVHRHNSVAVACYKKLGFVSNTTPEQENSRLYFFKLPVDDAITRAQQYLQTP